VAIEEIAMKAKFLVLASAGLCMSGCASVLSSQNVASLDAEARKSGRAEGEVYFLPRAIITAFVLVDPNTGIEIGLAPPKLVVDNQRLYGSTEAIPAAYLKECATATDPPVTGPFVLNYSATGFHKDEITVEVEDGLLKTANAKSDEQISLIAPKLAESIGMLENDASLNAVYSTTFDPGDCRSVAAARYRLNQAILTRGLPELRQLNGDFVVARDLGQKDSLFYLGVQDHEPFRFPVGARPTAADCAKGICVPVPTPAYVSLGSGNTLRRGPMMMIPNGSDPTVIPIDRSAFANVDTKLSLNAGVLTKRQVTRTSEALTIVSIPAAIVGAYLDAIMGVFTKRKAAFDAENAYREAVEALEKEQADAAKQENDASGDGLLLRIGIVGAYKPAPRIQVLAPVENGSPAVNGGAPSVAGSDDGH
jgi:hypothetical protein